MLLLFGAIAKRAAKYHRRSPMNRAAANGQVPRELGRLVVVAPLAFIQREAARRGKQQPDTELARINHDIAILGFVDILKAAG